MKARGRNLYVSFPSLPLLPSPPRFIRPSLDLLTRFTLYRHARLTRENTIEMTEQMKLFFGI